MSHSQNFHVVNTDATNPKAWYFTTDILYPFFHLVCARGLHFPVGRYKTNITKVQTENEHKEWEYWDCSRLSAVWINCVLAREAGGRMSRRRFYPSDCGLELCCSFRMAIGCEIELLSGNLLWILWKHWRHIIRCFRRRGRGIGQCAKENVINLMEFFIGIILNWTTWFFYLCIW